MFVDHWLCLDQSRVCLRFFFAKDHWVRIDTKVLLWLDKVVIKKPAVCINLSVDHDRFKSPLCNLITLFTYTYLTDRLC